MTGKKINSDMWRIYAEKQQERQKLQERQKEIMPAICHFCGSKNNVIQYVDDKGIWVQYYSETKKGYNRFLCANCAKMVKPSLMSLIDRGDRNALRAIPIYDCRCNLLQTTKKSQLEVQPNYYPAFYLGGLELKTLWQSVTYIADCYVLTLVPDKDQNYWIDQHVPMFGHILTAFSLSYNFPRVNLPCRIKLTSFFDRDDRPRVAIWRLNSG